MLDELDTAKRLAGAAAERWPESGRLQAILLAIADARQELQEPAAGVPEGLRANHHVAFTVAQLYAQRRNFDGAAEWIKISLAASPDDWQSRKAYAELLLQRAVGSELFLLAGTSELRADFEAASLKLEEIWEVVRNGEQIEASAVIAAQVAIARTVAGDRSGARQACDAGLAMKEPPPVPLLRVAVKLAEEERRFEDALALLGKTDTKQMPERNMLIATAQFALGHHNDAVTTLTNLAHDSDAEPALRAAARARSIEIRARLEGDLHCSTMRSPLLALSQK